ncbi:MAG: prepilin-type N-terminal cleavage/methylation domain-containing protein [Planctomycetota bacterium]|nr:MAG: prepilin-type N-terminal cleavage/methylation domain-containing protein [Planctomycetota bacterium]
MPAARRRAFTLVELLISMALGTILVGIVSFVFVQSSNVYNATLDEMHGSFVLRVGQDLLGRDLRSLVPPVNDHTLLKIQAVDGPTGAEDVLEYTCWGPNGAGDVVPLKVRVSIKNGFLIREVYEEGDGTPTGYTALTPPRETDLGGDVVGFRVEYAWPDSAGLSFRRDVGTGGATAANGTLFCHYGTGDLSANTFTAGTAYAGGTAPAALATTLYVRDVDLGGAFRIASRGTNTYTLADTVPTANGLAFAVPVLPPALRLTITQQTGQGTRARARSMQRVLKIAR